MGKTYQKFPVQVGKNNRLKVFRVKTLYLKTVYVKTFYAKKSF